MKKKHPEHVNLERWLVSYADFVTLLFATFVMLFAMSKQDAEKMKAVAASIRAAFSGGTIDLQGAGGGDTINQFEQPEPPGGRVISLPAGKANTAQDPDPQMQEVRDQLEQTINLEASTTEPGAKPDMKYDSRGLVISLNARDFYDVGEVEVRPDLRPVLDQIARVVRTTRRLVRVEGHADEGEASKTNFPSSWELSAARATWVVRYWVKRFDLDPARIGAAGYGHYRPIAKPKAPGSIQDTYSRGANRRIEVIILNNLYENP